MELKLRRLMVFGSRLMMLLIVPYGIETRQGENGCNHGYDF